MSVKEKLAQLEIELPEVPTPVAAYVPALVDRGVVRTSGQLPFLDGSLVSEGLCGTVAVTNKRAKAAARQAALNALAAAAAAAGGLDNLESVVRVVVYVASTDGFFAQPEIANGASEILMEIFGVPHVRSAVGVAALPLNATVEVEVEFALI
ncbi:RidA family protein [Actinomycetaceae bacterium MB13-C1-2]|nr:RidA family protein [Actinomycetaceae bacterium MB13-C1-2]